MKGPGPRVQGAQACRAQGLGFWVRINSPVAKHPRGVMLTRVCTSAPSPAGGGLLPPQGPCSPAAWRATGGIRTQSAWGTPSSGPGGGARCCHSRGTRGAPPPPELRLLAVMPPFCVAQRSVTIARGLDRQQAPLTPSAPGLPACLLALDQVPTRERPCGPLAGRLVGFGQRYGCWSARFCRIAAAVTQKSLQGVHTPLLLECTHTGPEHRALSC